MELDILFLAKLFPPEMQNEIFNKSENNMKDAENALQWAIIEGLEKNSNSIIKIINVIPVSSYPKYYKDCFIKTTTFEHCPGASDINVGFFNLCYVKHALLKYSIFKHLKKWAKHNKDKKKVLIIYTLNNAFLSCVQLIKRIDPSIKCCAIVADLPDFIYLSKKKRVFLNLYLNYNKKMYKKKLKYFDMFVLLTEQMKDFMNIKQPYVVMEGIATDAFSDIHVDNSLNNIKTILYSGTLNEKFGILNLLEAFKRIKKENYRLLLCGVGDSVDKILLASKQDNRIIYLAQLPRNEVLKLQLQATVLVNPRQNNEEFTKYSFPSKNLEYLSSGRPVIAYKLDGIPEEYGEYIQYVNNDSIEALADKIIEICEKDSKELDMIGKRSKEFVLKNKNKFVQTMKIIKLMIKSSDKIRL